MSFSDIFDFAEQCGTKVLNKRQLENLIKAGAFDSIHSNRHKLFNSVDIIIKHCQLSQEEKESNQVSLFGGENENQISKPLLREIHDWTETERLQNECDSIGFYLTDHPLTAYKKFISHLKPVYSNEFTKRLGSDFKEIRIVGIIAGKKIKFSQRGKFGFIQLSDPEGTFEITVYDEGILAQKEILETGNKVYVICDGKKESDDQYRLIAKKIIPLEEQLNKKNIDIEVKIETEEEVEQLKNQLDKMDKGNGIITVVVPIDENKTVNIKLKHGYNITPDNWLF